jgi:hypothetical protein
MVLGGVQRIGSDHDPGQVKNVQQRSEPGDLAGLVLDLDLRQNCAELVGQRSHQMHPTSAVSPAGTPQRFAVHRNHHTGHPVLSHGVLTGMRKVSCYQPRADCGVHRVGVHGLQHPPHRGLVRRQIPAAAAVVPRTQPSEHTLRRIRCHSPIAVNDRAPAHTAAAAIARIELTACRTPRFFRGSGTTARYFRRSATPSDTTADTIPSDKAGATRTRTAGTSEDIAAGTALSHDHGASTTT